MQRTQGFLAAGLKGFCLILFVVMFVNQAQRPVSLLGKNQVQNELDSISDKIRHLQALHDERINIVKELLRHVRASQMQEESEIQRIKHQTFKSLQELSSEIEQNSDRTSSLLFKNFTKLAMSVEGQLTQMATKARSLQDKLRGINDDKIQTLSELRRQQRQTLSGSRRSIRETKHMLLKSIKAENKDVKVEDEKTVQTLQSKFRNFKDQVDSFHQEAEGEIHVQQSLISGLKKNVETHEARNTMTLQNLKNNLEANKKMAIEHLMKLQALQDDRLKSLSALNASLLDAEKSHPISLQNLERQEQTLVQRIHDRDEQDEAALMAMKAASDKLAEEAEDAINDQNSEGDSIDQKLEGDISAWLDEVESNYDVVEQETIVANMTLDNDKDSVRRAVQEIHRGEERFARMVEPLDIKLDALKRRISEGKLRLEDKLLHAEKKTSKFSSSIAAGLQQLSAALQKSEEEFDDKLDKARSSFAAAAAVVKAKESAMDSQLAAQVKRSLAPVRTRMKEDKRRLERILNDRKTSNQANVSAVLPVLPPGVRVE